MKSTWKKDGSSFAALDHSRRADVLVIGAGITGLTTAYLLKEAGLSVLVADRHEIGSGETGRTTAHVTMVTDPRMKELSSSQGKDRARNSWLAGQQAIETIDRIVRQSLIDCQWQRVDGYLCESLDGSIGQSHAALIDERNLIKELGFEVSFTDAMPNLGRPALCFRQQAVFHPLQYLEGLAKCVNGGECSVHENSPVELGDDGVARIHGHEVRYDKVVMATHVPMKGLTPLASARLFQTKLAPYSTYAVGGRLAGAYATPFLAWDTHDPYRYLRIHEDEQGTYAILGGEDHKTGQDSHPHGRIETLKRLLTRLIPNIRLDHEWSGQVIETHDGLPYIGPTTEQQFIATGFSGNGMTFGTVSALMARDWIFGRKNDWSDVFSPRRMLPLSSTWEYLKENKDYPLYYVTDRLSSPAREPLESVGRGEGRVISIEGERWAVSRDEDGEMHACSAVCTHMGCIVRWNDEEKSWDCACHGSRFTMTGDVICGPAEQPLKAKLPETALADRHAP